MERRLGLPNSNPPRHQRLCRARPRRFRAHLVARFRPFVLAGWASSLRHVEPEKGAHGQLQRGESPALERMPRCRRHQRRLGLSCRVGGMGRSRSVLLPLKHKQCYSLRKIVCTSDQIEKATLAVGSTENWKDCPTRIVAGTLTFFSRPFAFSCMCWPPGTVALTV